jgi:hypothetical protein
MCERRLQQQILNFCKRAGILAFKFQSPAHAGVPDLILLADGKTLFIELKHPAGTGRLSELQKVTIAKMQAHGATVYVSHDYQSLTETILQFFTP